MSDLCERLRRIAHPNSTEGRVATAAAQEIERLRSLLVEANSSFDDCTGDHAKHCVAGEPWREFRSAW